MQRNRKLTFVLFLILIAFFLRGVFLVVVFPIFKGQDEARHYNTIQYLSTDKKRNCQKKQTSNKQIKGDFSTYRYSDEIKQVSKVSQINRLKKREYNKIDFTPHSIFGLGEQEFNNQKYSKIQHICPPDIATSAFGYDHFSLYHKLLVSIEKKFSQSNIFIRYNVLRIVSVALGTVMLFVAYFIFVNIGFNKKQGLLLTAIISFQPRLSIYFSNINYDTLLIFLWTIFIFIGVLILKKGWNIYRFIALTAVTYLAIITKPSALPLVGLFGYLSLVTIVGRYRKKIGLSKKRIVIVSAFVIGLLVVTSYFLLKKVGLINFIQNIDWQKLFLYLNKSLPKIQGSSRNYWGAIGWNLHNLTVYYVRLIWVMEWLAWVGLFIWLLPNNFKNLKIFHKIKEFFRDNANFKKRYFIFMLASILFLQLGIRVADWRVFVYSGSLSLGTPGRYWLPNIIPHIALLGVGWAVIFSAFTVNKAIRQRCLNFALKAFLLIMVLFWTHEVFNIIIPRFYL